MVFFYIFNFFAIFLEFSFTPRVRMERKDNFYFLSFAAFSCLFLLEMKPQRYFFNFLNFLAICLEFSITYRVGTERSGTERNDNFYFSLSHLFPPYFGLKWIYNGIFLIFFVIFLEFSFLPRVRVERKDNFRFLSFAVFSCLFSLQMKPQWYFLTFLIF